MAIKYEGKMKNADVIRFFIVFITAIVMFIIFSYRYYVNGEIIELIGCLISLPGILLFGRKLHKEHLKKKQILNQTKEGTFKRRKN